MSQKLDIFARFQTRGRTQFYLTNNSQILEDIGPTKLEFILLSIYYHKRSVTVGVRKIKYEQY